MDGIIEAFKIEWQLLLAQLVNFLLLLAILYAFLYRPVLNMLAKRKERITQSMKDAERVSAAAQEAEQEATDIRMKAQADAKQQLESVMADANKQVADLAILATEQLLGRELAQKDEQRRFVAEFLAQQNGATSAPAR